MYDCPKIEDLPTEQFVSRTCDDQTRTRSWAHRVTLFLQHHTIDLNIKGTFFLTRAAVPHMGKGSSIIVTASQVAYAGPPSLLDYTMTKAAQVGMVRALSNQLIGRGIRVNAVCPGEFGGLRDSLLRVKYQY
jgi:NAD(P)-dependent dehydrogenase (short-subunit alcohol dehydrogenase family)